MRKNAVYILGGGIKQDKNGRWRSTEFGEIGIWGRVQGSKLRVVAAFYLYRENPDRLLISSGGAGGHYKNLPGVKPVGEIMKDELRELGAPAADILVENESNNTFEQLKKLEEIIKKYSLKRVVIISNQYHLPRIEAMIENVADLAGLNKFYKNSSLRLQSAEDIVLRFDSAKWRDIIEKTYQSEDMKARLKSEEQGVRQIKDGTYKLR